MATSYTNSKGKVYYFHIGNSRNAKATYFSSKNVSKTGKAAQEIPADATIIENPKTGLPMLKGKKKKEE